MSAVDGAGEVGGWFGKNSLVGGCQVLADLLRSPYPFFYSFEVHEILTVRGDFFLRGD